VSVSVPAPARRPDAKRARPASSADIPALSYTLAAAFFDDPVFSYCYPDLAQRRQILRRWFEIVTEANLPHGEIYTTDDVVAGAVWVPPGVDDDEQMGTALGEISGKYAQTLFEIFERMEEGHPREAHHYLFLLGTRPDWQSRGIGSALMRPVLELCDRDAMPAYLEATSEANMRLYLRHGFEVAGEIKLPDGPSMWPMWRTPKQGRSWRRARTGVRRRLHAGSAR
jgi:ribosomal protein S18 acetylase RimI-like enzyme